MSWPSWRSLSTPYRFQHFIPDTKSHKSAVALKSPLVFLDIVKFLTALMLARELGLETMRLDKFDSKAVSCPSPEPVCYTCLSFFFLSSFFRKRVYRHSGMTQNIAFSNVWIEGWTEGGGYASPHRHLRGDITALKDS